MVRRARHHDHSGAVPAPLPSLPGTSVSRNAAVNTYSGMPPTPPVVGYRAKRPRRRFLLLLVPAAAPVVPAPVVPTVLLVPSPPATGPVPVVMVTGIGVECCFTETEDVHDPHISILSLVRRNFLHQGRQTISGSCYHKWMTRRQGVAFTPASRVLAVRDSPRAMASQPWETLRSLVIALTYRRDVANAAAGLHNGRRAMRVQVARSLVEI
jgi:hypothetical protein